MTAEITVFRNGQVLERAAQAELLEQAVLPFQEDFPEEVDGFLYRIHRSLPSRGKALFVLLYFNNNKFVVRHLLKHSKCPMQAVALWAECFEHLDERTGEIRRTRYELAEDTGIPVKNVSQIMGELNKFGAIITHRQKIDGMRGPGMARYFMNPKVATHLQGMARDLAQKAAPQLALPEPKEMRLHLVSP